MRADADKTARSQTGKTEFPGGTSSLRRLRHRAWLRVVPKRSRRFFSVALLLDSLIRLSVPARSVRRGLLLILRFQRCKPGRDKVGIAAPAGDDLVQ